MVSFVENYARGFEIWFRVIIGRNENQQYYMRRGVVGTKYQHRCDSATGMSSKLITGIMLMFSKTAQPPMQYCFYSTAL